MTNKLTIILWSKTCHRDWTDDDTLLYAVIRTTKFFPQNNVRARIHIDDIDVRHGRRRYGGVWYVLAESWLPR